MTRTLLAGLLAGFLLLPSGGALQAQAAPADFLSPGTAAPDVQLGGATRWGKLAEPVRLSDFRGKTVVLAFFPAARTRGCTIQMKAYRDEYLRLLDGGGRMVLIGISNDPEETLVSWAQDEDFPFLFGSDPTGAAYRAFGGTPGETGRLGRTLVVVDPQGQIAELIPRFMEIDPAAYDELASIVSRVTPPAAGEDR